MTDRRAWLARLPEMRLAYFELEDAFQMPETGPLTVLDATAELWEQFNDWRLQSRPALGRIDIAALGMLMPGESGRASYRAAVPIRSDYRPAEPAKTAYFPGGSFVYVYADNMDEMEFAAETALQAARDEGFAVVGGQIEVYKFHYNLEQHPCDAGFLVTNADGSEPVPPPSSHSNPLPIAR